jgi:hypothetical protein
MESNGSDWLDCAESILDQLLKLTAQLAEIEKDPEVDAKALSDACAQRLDDLKRLIPQDLKGLPPAKNEVLEKMHDLYSQTHVCLEILGKKSSRAAARLQLLTKKKRAIMAYSGQRGRED